MEMHPRFGKLGMAAVGLVALILASCVTTPAPSGTSSTSAGTQGTTITKPEGSLKIGGELLAGSHLDPQTAASGWFANLTQTAIYDTILTPDPDGVKGPGIVERWEIAPDGMSQTFFVRKGVKFHDGSDLTGADIKFSIERVMLPQGITIQSPVWRNQIANVELKDDYTVVVRLKQRSYDLLSYLEFFSAGVVPKKFVEEKGVDYFSKNAVGSGPWKVVSFTPGVKLELEAVENHWRGIVPKFKNITILNVTEESTKVAMLKTGELDMAQVGADSVAGLKSAGLRVQGYDAGSQVMGTIWFDRENPQKNALGDVRVRKAVQLAINGQEMVDNLLGGAGSKFALVGVSPKAWFFDSNVIKLDPYDPEGAKKLLAEAGYPNGFTAKIWDHGGFQSTISLAIGGYWRKVGVTPDVVPIETGAFYPLYRPTPQPQLWNSFRIGTQGVESLEWSLMMTLYHSTKGAHKNANNPKLDELLDKVPSTADPAEKKRLGIEAARMAKEEYTQLPIMSFYLNVAYGSKIGQIAPYRNSYGISGLQLETITHAK